MKSLRKYQSQLGTALGRYGTIYVHPTASNRDAVPAYKARHGTVPVYKANKATLTKHLQIIRTIVIQYCDQVMIALGLAADCWCAEVVLTFDFFFKPYKVLHKRILKNQSYIDCFWRLVLVGTVIG